MNYRLLMTVVFLSAAVASGQSINQQLNNQSILEVTRDGVTVSFNIRDAMELSKKLLESTESHRPENEYMPPYLKERLQWLKDNAMTGIDPRLPPEWDNGQTTLRRSATMASADYCTLSPPANWNDRPCAYIRSTMVMILLRFEYHLTQPDQRFKNEFALYLGHESIHLEKDKSFFHKVVSHEERVAEETRTWFKMCRDMIRPLRLAKQPVGKSMELVDDVARACGYKLPCKEFTAYVKTKLVN